MSKENTLPKPLIRCQECKETFDEPTFCCITDDIICPACLHQAMRLFYIEIDQLIDGKYQKASDYNKNLTILSPQHEKYK
jgi:hypothetical protein